MCVVVVCLHAVCVCFNKSNQTCFHKSSLGALPEVRVHLTPNTAMDDTSCFVKCTLVITVPKEVCDARTHIHTHTTGARKKHICITHVTAFVVFGVCVYVCGVCGCV